MKENKEKTKSGLKGVIATSIILIIIFIILSIKASQDHSWDSLGYTGMALVDVFVLWLMWVIYLIKLTIIKRKNNSKYYWIPLVIDIFIIIAPILLYFIVFSIRISYKV